MMKQRATPGEMTRRAALGALAAGGVGFALFGPRGDDDRATTRGKIVLDYWEKWTRHEGDAMRKVVDLFNASQDRIHVRYRVTADIGQKSMVAIAGGAPPDLIGLYAFNVPGYAESGALLPLDELGPKFGVTLDRYAAGVRPVMLHKGPGGKTWWACVNTAGSVALYYSKAAFREAGLDPQRPPRTIGELDDYHRRLTKRGPRGELERVGFFHPEPGWWSWIWAYHFGGSIYDEARDRATVDSRENVAAMEWMQSYPRELGVRECQAFKESFGNYFTPENPWLTGKVAMIVQGPWVANLVGAFKPGFEYGVAAFPVAEVGTNAEVVESEGGTQRRELGRTDSSPLRSSSPSAPSAFASGAPVGHIDTDVLVIPRGARHPEASAEFLAWTQRQDMTEMLATAHCKPSPLAVASDEFLAKHPNKGVQVHYDIFKSPRAFLSPRTRVWQQFKDEFDTVVQRLWRLEANAGEAMTALQPRVQGFLDQAARERRRRAGA